METKAAITRLLVIHLKSGFRRLPVLEFAVTPIVLEDELSYTLQLNPGVHNAGAQVVAKADVNEIRYVQVYSNIDGESYTHLDVYVYAELDENSNPEEFLEFWSEEIKQRAMLELTAQRDMVKDMYRSIESTL